MIAKDMGMIAVGITATLIVLVLPLLCFRIAEIIMSRIGKKESGLPIFECPPPPPPKGKIIQEEKRRFFILFAILKYHGKKKQEHISFGFSNTEFPNRERIQYDIAKLKNAREACITNIMEVSQQEHNSWLK